MVDYYGLPQGGSGKWPGRIADSSLNLKEKAHFLESALLVDVCKDMGKGYYPNRFIPYVMMHEIEAMLFSDCNLFSLGIDRPELASSFQEIRNSFDSPEEIDDSPDGAPSKRIEALSISYEKPLDGILAIKRIGLKRIREECPLFSKWLNTLEGV